MIELYTWGTSNGRKASIMVEELGIPYEVHPVDLGKGEQFSPGFTRINPNQKIPAIVDTEGPGGQPIAVFESGAILIYLAEKHGRFFPQEPRRRIEVLQWLMFQMGNVGPFFGQVHHFRRFAKEKVPYAIERYDQECRKLYAVMNGQLADHPYLAADEYSIADIATWPWVLRHPWQEVNLVDYPHVQRWFEAIHARPAVQKGIQIPA
jgi:GST-like protein